MTLSLTAMKMYMSLSADMTKRSFWHFLCIQYFKNVLNFNILHVLKIESNYFLLVLIQSNTHTFLIKSNDKYVYNVCCHGNSMDFPLSLKQGTSFLMLL